MALKLRISQKKTLAINIDLPDDFSKVSSDDEIDIGRKLDKANVLLSTLIVDNKSGFNDNKSGFNDIKIGINNMTTIMLEQNKRMDEHNTRLEAMQKEHNAGQREHNTRSKQSLKN